MLTKTQSGIILPLQVLPGEEMAFQRKSQWRSFFPALPFQPGRIVFEPIVYPIVSSQVPQPTGWSKWKTGYEL